MVTPPMAGPTMRAELKAIELRAMAFGSSGRGTRSAASDWRSGMSSAFTSPSRNESSMMRPMSIAPASVRTSSTSTWTDAAACVASSALRRSSRSTYTPPNGASTIDGTNSSAATIPSCSGEPPSASTSHGSETCCIQVPTRLISWPPK